MHERDSSRWNNEPLELLDRIWKGRADDYKIFQANLRMRAGWHSPLKQFDLYPVDSISFQHCFQGRQRAVTDNKWQIFLCKLSCPPGFICAVDYDSKQTIKLRKNAGNYKEEVGMFVAWLIHPNCSVDRSVVGRPIGHLLVGLTRQQGVASHWQCSRYWVHHSELNSLIS